MVWYLTATTFTSLFSTWQPGDWVTLAGAVVGGFFLLSVARRNNKGRTTKEDFDQKQEDITGYRLEVENMRREIAALRLEVGKLTHNYGLLHDYSLMMRNDVREKLGEEAVREWPQNLIHPGG